MKHWEIRSFNHLKEMLISDNDFRNDFLSNPEQTLFEAKNKTTPLAWDKWIYRIAVFGLTVIILIVIIAVVVMYALNGTETFEVPDLFVAIGSGAIGAIAGLLTPTATEKKEE